MAEVAEGEECNFSSKGHILKKATNESERELACFIIIIMQVKMKHNIADTRNFKYKINL